MSGPAGSRPAAGSITHGQPTRIPSPAGCREPGWGHLSRHPLPALQGASAIRGGNAAGTLERISLGRAGALDSAGCWVHAVHDAFGEGREGGWLLCAHHPARGTHHPSGIHPPPIRGLPPPSWAAPTAQPIRRLCLTRSLLSGQGSVGLGRSRCHQPPGVSGGPHSPAVSPRALWASAVCVAGQAAAVSPGYISLPGIRCKGAVPAKAAESSRIGSREGECRWRLPYTHLQL